MSFWPQTEKQILPFSMAKNNQIKLSDAYWYEPVLTSVLPLFVSAEENLDMILN
jgi:hypothetical protein